VEKDSIFLPNPPPTDSIESCPLGHTGARRPFFADRAGTNSHFVRFATTRRVAVQRDVFLRPHTTSKKPPLVGSPDLTFALPGFGRADAVLSFPGFGG
jgi:hypothetical protein